MNRKIKHGCKYSMRKNPNLDFWRSRFWFLVQGGCLYRFTGQPVPRSCDSIRKGSLGDRDTHFRKMKSFVACQTDLPRRHVRSTLASDSRWNGHMTPWQSQGCYSRAGRGTPWDSRVPRQAPRSWTSMYSEFKAGVMWYRRLILFELQS